MSTYNDIRQQMLDLRAKVQEIADPHLSIQSSDEQYDDPELWWSQPLLDDLNAALDNLDANG